MNNIEMYEEIRKTLPFGNKIFNIGKMFSKLLYTNIKNKYFKNCQLKIM